MIDNDKKNTKEDLSESSRSQKPISDGDLEKEIDDISSDPDFLKIKSVLDDLDKNSEDE